MAQHIRQGTAQELAAYLAQRPQGRFCLIELEDSEQPVTEHDEAKPPIDAENAAAIALLKSWREQDATDDPEELRRAEEELAEFKRDMNANRIATDERLVYL